MTTKQLLRESTERYTLESKAHNLILVAALLLIWLATAWLGDGSFRDYEASTGVVLVFLMARTNSLRSEIRQLKDIIGGKD